MFSKVKQAHGVALGGEEVGERGRGGPGVVDLGVRARGVTHRPAHVEHEGAAEVGLVLEPLDVVAVGSGEQPPVEIARVVARAVFAVFAELDREPVIGTAVNPFHEPLDRDPRPDLQALDPHQGRRVDQRRARDRTGLRRPGSRRRLGAGSSTDITWRVPSHGRAGGRSRRRRSRRRPRRGSRARSGVARWDGPVRGRRRG